MVCADLPQEGLSARSQRAGIEFLMRELEIGITFAKIVITEQHFGNHDHLKQSRENTMKAYSSFMRFLPTVEGHMTTAEWREIQEKREEFEALIQQFWHQP